MDNKTYFSIVAELLKGIRVDGSNTNILRALANTIDETLVRLDEANKSTPSLDNTENKRI